jgi:hypothetical protein
MTYGIISVISKKKENVSTVRDGFNCLKMTEE